MALSIKRAEWVSLAGLAVHFVAGVITLIVGMLPDSASPATVTVGWQVLGGSVVWLLLALQYHQRRLADEERLELEALKRERVAQLGGDATIFDEEADEDLDVISARRRLRWLERIFSPVVALLLAVYLVAMGGYRLVDTALHEVARESLERPGSLAAAGILALLMLFQFLLSRYATGMSRYGPWSYLRAGGGYSLGTAVTTALAAATQLLLNIGQFWAENILVWITPILMILLGIEIVINFVMDFYRPRVKGQLPRPSYDSRLLGLFSEPEGVLASMAHAIDYQFGFKVSQTWFYKLLQRTVVWLLIFQAGTLYLLTCFAMVGPDEEAIKTHFGTPVRDASGRTKVFGPDLYVKWPWPIDNFHTYPTQRIQQFQFAAEKEPQEHDDEGELLLWTNPHGVTHEQLLVPLPERSQTIAKQAAGKEEYVPVAIFNGWVVVNWRVRTGGLPDFLLNHQNSEAMLHDRAWQVLTQYLANVDFQDILAAGREKASRDLTSRLQKAVDDDRLGVQVLHVGVWDLHPPARDSVALNYLAVNGAELGRDAEVFGAKGEADRILVEMCGSVEAANELAAKLTAPPDAGARGAAGRKSVLEMMDEANVTGAVKAGLLNAQSEAFKYVSKAEADSVLFGAQDAAYRKSPSVFMTRHRQGVLDEVLSQKTVRKYLNMTDSPLLLQTNLEEKLVDVFDMDLTGQKPQEEISQ